MKWDKALTPVNIIVPLIGIVLLIFYEICDTSCSSLRGTFLGLDLKVVSILFMVALLTMIPLSRLRFSMPVHLRTMMLAGAVGGETLLVRFQVVNDTYCPFCLAFGLCVLTLFAANIPRMNNYLAFCAFCAGILAFSLFFQGSILPLYG